MSSVHSTISYGMSIGNGFVSGQSTAYDNGSVTSDSKRGFSGKGTEAFAIGMPAGYSAECIQKLHSIVPHVSNIMSQLAFTNLKDNDLKDLAEEYIKNRHLEAVQFCTQQKQYQQRKEVGEKALDQVSSDVKSSSLPSSSYVPKNTTTYKFPNANYLGACLERDPSTSKENQPYFYEKGIIPKITETFAGQIRNAGGIELGVYLTMEGMELRPPLSVSIGMNVIEALKACAQEEKTENSK